MKVSCARSILLEMLKGLNLRSQTATILKKRGYATNQISNHCKSWKSACICAKLFTMEGQTEHWKNWVGGDSFKPLNLYAEWSLVGLRCYIPHHS